MRLPKAIQNLIDSFEKLPGIGPKTAERLTFYLLHVPQGQLDSFASSLQQLKTSTRLCDQCFTITESQLCGICSDPLRDTSLICVVEEALDVIALEKSDKYKGLYHVLHGRIDPLNNIGPDEIRIRELMQRIRDKGSMIREVILATNPTMEGEATAMFLAKQLRTIPLRQPADGGEELKITRIGRGLPVGADIEYADGITLQRAMEGRSEI